MVGAQLRQGHHPDEAGEGDEPGDGQGDEKDAGRHGRDPSPETVVEAARGVAARRPFEEDALRAGRVNNGPADHDPFSPWEKVARSAG